MSEQYDIGALFSQIGQLQQNLREAREAAAAEIVEGSAGGGVVRIEVSGALEFKKVIIDASVVDPADVEMLQDLVLAAIRDSVERVSSLAGSAVDQVGLDLPGLDLPGLGGLLGRGEP